MTAALISTAEVGNTPASAEPCPDHDTRERPAAVITSASGGGKISSTTENGPDAVLVTPRPGPKPYPCPLSTPEGPAHMMPWAGRASLRTHMSAVTPGGAR